MSDQDMQFADPDWKPTSPLARNTSARGKQRPATPASSGSPASFQPRPVNDQRRDQSQAPAIETTAEPYERGYGGLPPSTGTTGSMPARQQPYQPYQGLQMRYSRRRRSPWLWIILIILLFSLLGGGFGSIGSIGQKNVVQDHYYSVTGTPTIVVRESSGNIQVQQGNKLDIQTNKQSGWFDDPNNINVNIQQNGSTITVNASTGSGGFLSDRSVDFTITVPQNVNLDLQTGSGDINVNNVNGQATLVTDSGNISAFGDTFSANAKLQTSSGDVQVSQDTFADGTGITTSSGDITLDRDALQGSESFSTGSGDIQFTGSVDPAGTYKFSSNSGDIDMALQPGDSFSVYAQTGSGSINADDFPTILVQSVNQGASESASGTVGTSPFAQLTLTTQSGDININGH
jgi:DUF4097 and DUF4098 domain-containing protein YvlB